MDLFQFYKKDGIIDYASLQEYKDMTKRQFYLKMFQNTGKEIHPPCKGGNRYYARVPDIRKPKRKDGTYPYKQVYGYTRDECEDRVVEAFKELTLAETVNPTLCELYTQYLDEGHFLSRTRYIYETEYKKYIGDFGNNRILDLGVNDIVRYLENTFHEKELTEDQYSRLKRIMKTIIDQAVRNDLIDYTFEIIKVKCKIKGRVLTKYRIVNDDNDTFNQDEQAKLIEYCKNSTKERDKALLLIMYTGMRRSELVALKWEDYNGVTLYIHRHEVSRVENGKHISYIEEGGKTCNSIRHIVLPPVAVTLLNELKASSKNQEYIFVDKKNKPLKGYMVFNSMRRLCQQTGIPFRPPHKLRAMYTSECVNNNIPLQIIQKNLGDKSLNVIQEHYLKNTMSDSKIQQTLLDVPMFQ